MSTSGQAPPGGDSHSWRRQLRATLLRQRETLSPAERRAGEAAIAARLCRLLPPPPGPVALYWPIRGEPDLRPLAAVLAARGYSLALPVIVRRRHPMVFRRWQPGRPLLRGVWNIPVPPAEAGELVPAVVVVPVVGVGPAGHRLGYGGGYYDRTLARLQPPPRVIGVGFPGARLAHFPAEPHDRPLDLYVDPHGVVSFARAAE